MEEEPPISKNQLKKLKRDQEWEANRDRRKVRRKEKAIERKQRRREAQGDGNVPAANGSLIPNLPGNNASIPNPPDNNASIPQSTTNICIPTKEKQRRFNAIQSPITIVLDCGFDELMTEMEIKSLGLQITRCYSANRKAPLKAHLAISSFGDRLKERFDDTLDGQYLSWKEVKFLESDYYEVAQQAKEWMKRPHGGLLLGPLAHHYNHSDPLPSSTEGRGQDQEAEAEAEAETEGEIVYLTSDSPETLTKLGPYSTYIIGGLVDRNRHKGVCYKRAMDRGVKTAKLPIGDLMEMNSRPVLATNHVAEIMLRWIELGDWGEAFLSVIPKRKGGTLKDRKGGLVLEEGDDGNGNGNGNGVAYKEPEEKKNPNDDEIKQTEFETAMEIDEDRNSKPPQRKRKREEESVIPKSQGEPVIEDEEEQGEEGEEGIERKGLQDEDSDDDDDDGHGHGVKFEVQQERDIPTEEDFISFDIETAMEVHEDSNSPPQRKSKRQRQREKKEELLKEEGWGAMHDEWKGIDGSTDLYSFLSL